MFYLELIVQRKKNCKYRDFQEICKILHFTYNNLLSERITSTKVIAIVKLRHKSIIIQLYHGLIVQNHLLQ